MYQYIYVYSGLPASISIEADNKKLAVLVLKEMGIYKECEFQERIKR